MLTNTEKEVLKQIVCGKTNSEISKNLYMSVSTVKTHVSSILYKLNAKNRVLAAVKGYILLNEQEKEKKQEIKK